MPHSKPHILFMAEPKREILDALGAHYTLHVMPMQKGPERDAMIAEAAPLAQVLIPISILAPSTEQVRMMTKLEHLAYLGAGYQSMDLALFKELGVTGSYVPAVNADAVAEYTLMLTLACVRRLFPADKFIRDGRWGPEFGPPMTPEFRGMKVGIVGFGEIGRRVAKLCDAFGACVAYHKPTATSDVSYQYYPELAPMARDVDVLIIACPGGPATRHMIDAEVLAALGPTGYLVNIARGSVVDNDALIPALKNGIIAGAALDVIEGEPDKVPADYLALDNVVLTPHRAGVTEPVVRAQAEGALKNLAAHFAGEPLPHPIPDLARD